MVTSVEKSVSSRRHLFYRRLFYYNYRFRKILMRFVFLMPSNIVLPLENLLLSTEKEGLKEKGVVHGGWVQQEAILGVKRERK
ncbi:uncharacterized protein G2W53_016437 [Senna tora]|uniref:Uncharacterized protein n=1 Tax=Senna tora TaxID=362788 RepID=A0A834WLI4_9FABA|nr:uncharacterized protein G2W53_016437 [Senna tora]